MASSLEQLLEGRPDGPVVDAAEIAQAVARRGRVLIVLDDDPTGTQSVADLPVLLSWSPEDLRWALSTGAPAVYVMTNSRSLAPAEAERVNREVAMSALAAADALGLRIDFVSRSDSTLRGHYPLEPQVLTDVVLAKGDAVDGIVIVPAFPDAGRITLDSVHYARDAAGDYLPVGESEFARDATFGYDSSDLRDWVAEKTGTDRDTARVVALPLAVLRTEEEATDALLQGLSDAQPLVVDIVDENDLRLLARALLRAEAAGSRFVYRVGPPFGRAIIGQAARAPLSVADVDAVRQSAPGETAAGGLVVIGSHVGLTTRQLDDLLAARGPRLVAVDVELVLSPQRDQHVADVVDEAVAALAGGDVVVRTTRTLVRGRDADDSLRIAREVSAAVVDVVRGILAATTPRFVVAKGGITSSDVAAHGLAIERAWVRGPMLPGIVSLWEPAEGPARGIPYVVFAGNVGDDTSLTKVVAKLADAAPGDDATDPKEKP